MNACFCTALCAAGTLLALAMPAHADSEFSGQVRVQREARADSGRGPLALASELVPAVVPPPGDVTMMETELRGRWRMLHAAAVLRQAHPDGASWHGEAAFNELYADSEAAGWHLSAGRKIVGWDVGYGWRPNDVVQQETRRTLLASTPQGRGVLQAERFGEDRATALVWVNPQRPRSAGAPGRGADEQALAARLYRRRGAADWHAFARWGERTRGSLGAAWSWVATDTLELHASARWAAHVDALVPDSSVQGLAMRNPYRAAMRANTTQALAGAGWTGESKFSLMAEAWFDGSAPSAAEWSQWRARNDGLAALLAPGAPAGLRQAVGGNLGWQGQSLLGQNLRRGNVYLRAAWDHEGWQPVLDMLYTPADAGRVVTASVGWQGDRLRIDGGVRLIGGPREAVLSQLPTRRIAYLAFTWSL